MSLRRSLSNKQHLKVFREETAELFSAVNERVGSVKCLPSVCKLDVGGHVP